MKTIIVTGATGNLGAAVVKKFVSEGYRVIGTITQRHQQTNLVLPENVALKVVDLTNENATSAFVCDVIAHYGQIDVAVLTVGGFTMGSIQNTTAKDLLQQYQINFETTYNAARPIFCQMVQQKMGSIFLIGSRPGQHAANSKGMVGYSLSKSLVFRLAEMMNAEAAGSPVHTTVVVPGTIDTPQNREAMPGADKSQWVSPDAIALKIFTHATAKAQTNNEPLIQL